MEQSTISNLHLERCRIVPLEPTGGKGAPLRSVNPRKAVAEALAAPLDYPLLADSFVPGDHVAIPVDETVPQIDEVVAGIVESVIEAGVDRESIAVIVADEKVERFLKERTDPELAVRIVVHDPADQNGLCYAGATRSNQPLLIQREIFEADVVIPVGCARPPGFAANRGIFECLFPRFSDEAAIGRHRTPKNLSNETRLHELREATDEAGWLMGAALIVQVVPGPNGTIADIVAGSPSAVSDRVDQVCRSLWTRRVTERPSLVIAVMSGEPHEQTWFNFARTLNAARQVVEEGGAVAVCTEISRRPGRSLQRLAEGDYEAAEDWLRDEDAEDSWPAWQLAGALKQGPVYLLSRIGPETVENLGMAPVADWEELSRLANRHESCLILDESQHVIVDVVE